MDIHDLIALTVALMASDPPAADEACIDRLAAAGCTELQAQLLVSLVPIALGRTLLAGRTGMLPILSEAAAIPSSTHFYFVRLASIPEFAWAEVAASGGAFPPEQVAKVGSRGSELRTMLGLVESGQTVKEIAEPMLLGVAETPGFAEWFEQFARSDRDVVAFPPLDGAP